MPTAKAELLAGTTPPRPNERIEQIYRALHNNTITGKDKVYRKAKEELGIK